ncbi:MAG: isoamylase [Treponema sp.]|nr:isoamylase [Candidatus Treponema equifaecale]
MKKSLFTLILLVSFLTAQGAFAKDKKTVETPDTYEYDQLVSKLSGVSAPYVKENYIVFTAPATSRSVGIAFDFEDFKIIHPFQLYKTHSYEGDVTNSWFFYVADRPKRTSRISYRLIIDGLWTTDPLNKNISYNSNEGYTLSYLDIDVKDPIITEKTASGLTHFVCFTESGQKIRLGGSFTNWDSWIYEMAEVAPGRYEIDIPLHAGTYYYSYYNGISSFIDSTNPVKGYSPDGRVVSCITIK